MMAGVLRGQIQMDFWQIECCTEYIIEAVIMCTIISKGNVDSRLECISCIHYVAVESKIWCPNITRKEVSKLRSSTFYYESYSVHPWIKKCVWTSKYLWRCIL